MRLGPAPRGPGLHLQLRMYVLRQLRDRAGSHLPELRGRAGRPPPPPAPVRGGQLSGPTRPGGQPTWAITSPWRAVWSSPTSSRTCPATGASTSPDTFSTITSASSCPLATWSPSLTNQVASTPSASGSLSDSRGNRTSAMLSGLDQVAHGRLDPFRRRQHRLLQRPRVRDRHVGHGDPAQRGPEQARVGLGYPRRDLPRQPERLVVLVDDEQ